MCCIFYEVSNFSFNVFLNESKTVMTPALWFASESNEARKRKTQLTMQINGIHSL